MLCEGPHGKIPHAQTDLYIQMSVHRARKGGPGSERQGGQNHILLILAFSILQLLLYILPPNMGREAWTGEGLNTGAVKTREAPEKGQRERKRKSPGKPRCSFCAREEDPRSSPRCSSVLAALQESSERLPACLNYHLFMVLPCASTVSEKPPLRLKGFIRGGWKEKQPEQVSARQ